MLGFPAVSLLSGDVSADPAGPDSLCAFRLWEAARDGAATIRTDTFGETRVVAWLTINGAFRHLAEARDSVSLLSGDDRRVYALDSDGYLIKTRCR